jgi:hypothetical protein
MFHLRAVLVSKIKGKISVCHVYSEISLSSLIMKLKCINITFWHSLQKIKRLKKDRPPVK